MRKIVTGCLLASGLFLSSSINAATLEVEFEIPRKDVEKYARPYVAIWTEQGKESTHQLVWHLQKKEDKWLADIKRWWRKIGRYDAHLDGVSGATKGPGHYKESFDIGDLDNFKLYIEVVRENGGRSLISQAISSSDNQNTYTIPADTEVGQVTATFTP